MRKITRQAANAFNTATPFRKGNTEVRMSGEGELVMVLHGNVIAKRQLCGEVIEISLAGWPTVTTRERINGLLDTKGSKYRIQQRRGKQCIVDVRQCTSPVADFPENGFVRAIG